MTEYIAATPRLEASTLKKYLRQKCEPIFRRSILMEGMKSHNRITFNHSGLEMEWRPRIKRRTITAGQGFSKRHSFPQVTREIKVTLPWRQYGMGSSITKQERLVNKGKAEQFFDLVKRTMDNDMEDFTKDFGLKLYSDGGGTSTDIHGLESIFSVSGLVGSGPAGNPNDTYAGTSTALAALGGSWTGDWPVGTGSYEYCAWSPLVVDYNATFFEGDTWAENWRQALRFGQMYLGKIQNQEPDVCVLDSELIRNAKDSLDSSDKFVVTVRPTTEVSFKEILFEDIKLAYEYGTPANVGYWLTWDMLELCSLQGQLVDLEEDKDITVGATDYAYDFWGNLKIWYPSGFGKLAAISAAGT